MNSSSIDLVDNMEEFLIYMVKALDPFAINITMSHLTLDQISDPQFLSAKFCNDHGNYLHSQNPVCHCDIAFFGIHCHKSGYDYWKQGWTTFQVFITLFFAILSIITWRNFRKNWKGEYGSLWKKVKRLCKTPKYLVMMNLLILCTSKTIYFAINPYRQNAIFSRVADRIIDELIISAAICVFYILLIVWIGLYSAFNGDIKAFKNLAIGKSNKHNPNQKNFRFFEIIKEIIIIIIFLIYPLQITFSYYRGSRTSDKDLLDIFLFILFGLMLIFIIVFAYFTCSLKISLSRSYEIPLINQQGQIIEDDEDIETSKVDVKDEIVFYNKLRENTRLNIIVKNLLNPERGQRLPKSKNNNGLDDIREEDENSDEDSDLELEYENEIININLEMFDSEDSINDLNIIQTNSKNNNNNEDNENIELKHNKRDSVFSSGWNPQLPKSGKDLVLTKNDMNILNKIFRLSYLTIIAVLFLSIIGLLIEHRVIISSPGGTIAVIIIAYIIEFIAIIAIFFLFVYDIKNDEYNNLKIIGDVSIFFNNSQIENYLKTNRNKNSKLKFDEIKSTSVYSRFKSFMNIEGKK